MRRQKRDWDGRKRDGRGGKGKERLTILPPMAVQVLPVVMPTPQMFSREKLR